MLGILASVCTTRLAPAQSLGDVAKKEEERRKAVKTTGKVYTNGNIKPDPTTPSTPPPPAPTSGDQTAKPASPAPGGTPEAAADTDKKGETYWRKRISDERDAAQKAQAFADALQSQINALQTEFVNRDDPAQRALIAAKRDKALADLERAKKDVQERTKAITAIQDEARRAGVPIGWVR